MTLFKTAGTLFTLRKGICTTPALCEFKYKAMDLLKLRHQVMEDPNYGKEASTTSTMPDTLGESVGKQRYELLCNLYGEDAFESKMKVINPNSTKETPNLIPCEDWRRQSSCLCKRDQYGAFYLMLYKNLPTRCSCGHWFELLSYADYYKKINERREKRYNVLKDNADFKKVEANLERLQSIFDQMAQNFKNMEPGTSDAFVKMKDMSDVWKSLIKTRKTIERALDEF